jgi:hypothetical protein
LAVQALTLANVRQALWDYASDVPFSTATLAQQQAVNSVINQVTERFLAQGKWRGLIVRLLLPVLNNRQVTLPDSLGTILGCRRYLDPSGCGNCWQQAFTIYSQWHDFSPSTIQGSTWNNQGIVPLGQGWPVFQDAPTAPFYVKVIADLAEPNSPTILLRGLDQYAGVIYQPGGTEGISVPIVTGTPQQTTQQFNLLSYWVKSSPTAGQVRLHAVDVTTGLETPMVIITPGKTVAGYRRYGVPGMCNGDVVEAICKRAYIPAISDNDQVIPSNMGAMKLGMMALQYEDRNDMENARLYMGEALALLDADQAEFNGDSEYPTFQMAADYGAGSIVNVM